ncbi:putative Rhodanese-like domain-containing protein [Helianthus annuus]|uniref:Rhodanese-like domain-containing protein n=1 Tax=Helianthus annuus TaxID=4232 RepID=A0A251UBH9_HELAN|nr:putative Rhodanese-like domain-containing protein [Helianthus annuus]KAJ0549713.1 putative Rhodanese-like domain-containing protein STR4 [Helianthus annuus]KAJ0556207.1 putative Rhodanese-like domain-containing protein [Helianthus annuus]KAJ0562668.1 putative Rhodanese-like domain-containing protein STR4 [Helianthus annuus]KAJ0728043.1 putative Rhodanese-like domain-containing protein STR4 [Helianthus annuus]
MIIPLATILSYLNFTSLSHTLPYFSLMESLSIILSSSPIPPNQNPKFPKFKTTKNLKSTNTTTSLKTQSLSFLFTTFHFPLSSLASEESPTAAKIDLESVVVSIDDFFNRYPFFVAGVVFVWLYVIPATEEYLRKYKFISAIDAFKKLKDDPDCQLLDIRDSKTLRVLGSPNLKLLNKNAVQVEFRQGDEEGFLKRVKESFKDPPPANTTVCILDNFDGESMKVAELLFKNGFKEAYAIRGGVRGTNGWLEIQESLLPPSVHITLKRKVKKSTEARNNGAIEQQSEVKSQPATVAEIKQTDNGYANTSKEPKTRSSSPYPMYPDMKPPSSPTPSKPQ